ncbi:hypothetical protein DLJ49_05670 [Rhodovulum sp. 12E13]|uniref:vWA domain-containing protein n=1 Tax=Rhodovulum sp. 12E13 TaxID=2203891 RepID=UPI000E1A3B83|nr:VWA-like domain-containing protein [Rhodovulum sp. 12E13]RDC74151.1 hypothetical protein DLJ49_05670 [Rhodovulum sp. 12E13]
MRDESSPGPAGPGPSRRGHSRRATRALQKLAEADPAFAALSLWVDHRDADTGAPEETRLDGDAEAPAWTDGRTVFYGPGFEAHDLDLQVGLAAHQILHVALRHPARDRALALRLGPKHDSRLFNVAADALVNETLIQAGYVLPRPCLTLAPLLSRALGESTPTAAALAKWDAEALTLALMQARGGSRTGGKGEGDAPAEGGEGGEDGRERGAGADEARAQAAQAAFAPDIDPSATAGGGAAEDAEDDAEWRQRLSRALEEGRLAGRGLGALGFRIADLPRSDVPWERHLRALAARALQDEPRAAWARPSRRWTGMEAEARAARRPVPVYEPGRTRGRPIPRVVVGIDASSSVDDARLSMFMGQVAGIARRAAAELHLMVFDDEVRSVAKVPPGGAESWLRRQPLARGGGTSFDDLFARAAALDPAVLIVLTDLDAPVPRKVRDLPVIWAVPAPPARRPPHGRVLDLSI